MVRLRLTYRRLGRKVFLGIFLIIENLIFNSQNPFFVGIVGKLVALGFLLSDIERISEVFHFEAPFKGFEGFLRFILVELTDREVAGNYKVSVQ